MKRFLSFNCHEALNTLFSLLGYELDLLFYEDKYFWRPECRPIPSNVTVFDRSRNLDNVNQLDYSCAIAFNSDSHWNRIKDLEIPKVLSFATTYFHPDRPKDESARPRSDTIQYLSKLNLVFCGYKQKERWGFGNFDFPVIYYGIDTNVFQGYKNNKFRILTTIHDFRERDNVCGYNFWKEITTGLPAENIGYQSDGLECRHTSNFEEVKRLYQNFSVYFDPTHCSPLSMSVLEAMSTGMPVVTTYHDDMSLIIKNDVNGIISNDKRYLKEKLKELLDKPEYRKRLGDNGRETIKQKFTIKQWQENWRKYFVKIGVELP